ncbi:UDP-N-acetylmuramate--L-alanine ligase [Alistipes timonensis JC136]|uniref:UDP-N-acetylmuramate--L-alanine ligase n=1 Tax=Alistipes timonensis JC136 TaxID=1033731 RepID=A0A1H4C0V1_9BACT|nr:UDP-N-acetylmuramate--L-alanine ligase [Alistipes timonensis]SEA53960.1 UDP-N-acetylmuramate--L-alanine ligase [Alistipes timonensis JC136]
MEYRNVYFLGIGGIGMSALARYFLHEGRRVAGYDRTRSRLTEELEAEGAAVHYEDDVRLIPGEFLDPRETMVVYTPAVPQDHSEYRYFTEHGFRIEKRSQMLGHLAEGKYVMAVAGTHGKTTTSTMVAWLNRVLTGGGSAFLGGISKNFGGNLVLGGGGRLAVEADEFDRSFLRLYPDVAVVTSADADHLDIYGTHEAVKEAFSQFVRQIRPDGFLIVKQGVDIVIDNPEITVYRYAYDTPCDFYARNVQLLEGGHYRYDIVTPGGVIAGCTLGIPGWINIENSVAAVASVWCAAQAEGTEPDADKLREALASFSGVKRRFEFYVNTPKQVYMDDYAHHPRELAATLTSVRGMFPGRRITALFQPHLYTRTRDLYAEFAEALSHADEVVLLPIYPAREEPIPGIASEIIADRVAVPCRIVERERLADAVAAMDTDVVISFGAGNIDACCEAIAEKLRVKS